MGKGNGGCSCECKSEPAAWTCGNRMVWGGLGVFFAIAGTIMIIVPMAVGGCSCSGQCAYEVNEICLNYFDGCLKGDYDAAACLTSGGGGSSLLSNCVSGTANTCTSTTKSSCTGTSGSSCPYTATNENDCTNCGEYWEESSSGNFYCTMTQTSACIQSSQSRCEGVKPAGSCTWNGPTGSGDCPDSCKFGGMSAGAMWALIVIGGIFDCLATVFCCGVCPCCCFLADAPVGGGPTVVVAAAPVGAAAPQTGTYTVNGQEMPVQENKA